MSTEIVELDDSPGDLEALENSLKVATRPTDPEQMPTPTQSAEQNQNAPGEIVSVEKPNYIQAKFWTGDVNESALKQAQAYPQLQSVYGRMANDLGTQRKITDQLLSLDKRSADPEPASEPSIKVDPVALVDNPTGELDRYFSVKAKELREELAAEERQTVMAQQEADFLSRHPDFQAVITSPEFVEFVEQSPARGRSAALARGGDFIVADELLTEFGDVRTPVTDTPQNGVAATQEELEAARRAGTESSAQAGGTPSGSKQTYRRADLIKLKMESPERYGDPDYQAEIQRAYLEGRVR
jgi:hypothetical protein